MSVKIHGHEHVFANDIQEVTVAGLDDLKDLRNDLKDLKKEFKNLLKDKIEKDDLDDTKKTIDGILKKKADTATVKANFEKIDELLKGGAFLKELNDLIGQRFQEIDDKCEEWHNQIKNSVAENKTLESNVSQIVNDHRQLLENSLGEFKVFIEKISTALLTTQHDLIQRQESIEKSQNKISHWITDYEQTCACFLQNLKNKHDEMLELDAGCRVLLQKTEKQYAELTAEQEKVQRLRQELETVRASTAEWRTFGGRLRWLFKGLNTGLNEKDA